MLSKTTQLMRLADYNPANVIITEPTDERAGAGGSIKYKRSRFQYRNEDGTIGNLVLIPGKKFSFGVFEKRDDKTGQVNGYSLGMSMYDPKHGPNEQEKSFLDFLESIAKLSEEFLLANKKLIKKPTLDASELRKLNPVSIQLDPETGEPMADKSPSLFCKLIYAPKKDIIYTKFVDIHGQKLNAKDLVRTRFFATPVIMIDSIYIGAKMSIQLQVMEAIAEIREMEHKSLLSGLIQERNDDEETQEP